MNHASRTASRALAAPLGLLTLLALSACGTSTAATRAAGPVPSEVTVAPPSASPSPSGTGSPAASPAPSSTAPSASTTTGAKPLAGKTVVIDPGHNPGNFSHATEINQQVDVGNGHKECDTTGTETDAGYTEAAYTLDVSHRIRDLLQSLGATVILTQDGNRAWGPCVDERAAIGNTAHADAAISVHGDGGPASGSGFHVIMPAKVVAGKADTSAIVDPSHRLGLLVRDSFHTATGSPTPTTSPTRAWTPAAISVV